MRDEGAGVFRSVEEAINVGKGAKIRVDMIHLKIADKKFWGQMNEIVSMINKARAEGSTYEPTCIPIPRGRTIFAPLSHLGPMTAAMRKCWSGFGTRNSARK